MTDHRVPEPNDPAELVELAGIETLLRDLEPTDLDLLEPPADVWAAIERELTADPRAEQPAPVVSLAERRSRRSAGSLLAVAAAALLIVGGTLFVAQRQDASEVVVASAELQFDAESFDPLGADASAVAELVERDGSFEIILTESSLPSELTESADLELWLIEANDDGEIVDVASVALVEGEGAYRVPASIDVATHRIVDISVEPRDGDDAHSGRSILRGALSA